MGAVNARAFTHYGLAKANLTKELSYFLLMPEPKGGWGHKLHYNETYSRLFKLLSDDATLKSIFYLVSKENLKHFTPKLLQNEFGLSQQKAADILTNLAAHDMVEAKELEIDNEMMTIYEFTPNVSLVPFLTFAEELFKRQDMMALFDNRNDTPYITRREPENQ